MAVTRKTETAVAKTAYGKSLEKPIHYSFEYDEASEYADIKPLTEQEQVDFRNNQAKANARQQELQVQLDAAKIERPTNENDPQFRIRNMVKTIMSDKSRDLTQAQAIAMAEQVLNVKWED